MNRGASWGSSARAAGLSELIAVSPDGRAEVADSSMRYPNGMVITPDGGTLIVAESQGQCPTAFTIAAGGELSAKRVWAAIPGSAPDGICLDQEGSVWFADDGSATCMRVAEGGEVRERIEVGQVCFACALGGDEGRTLFVTTSSFPTDAGFDPWPGMDTGLRGGRRRYGVALSGVGRCEAARRLLGRPQQPVPLPVHGVSAGPTRREPCTLARIGRGREPTHRRAWVPDGP